ncbi:MAG: hypothetical protein PHI53_00945 [Candidatus Pacebacteria bacterium]|nr:hypothetical protein [Candidatus Paceibacterota bacterium]
MLSKLFEFVKRYKEEIILFIGVVLISLLSFSVGYITAKKENKNIIRFETINDEKTATGER